MRRDTWPKIGRIAVTCALPVVLVVVSVWIVTGAWFVRWEYNRPGFPSDPGGFSQSERLELAEACVEYLVEPRDLSFLAALRLPNGEPAFDQRELEHMADVQAVYRGMDGVGWVSIGVVTVGLAGLAWRRSTRQEAFRALYQGALLTLALLVALGTFMLIDWWQFFSAFHALFFEGDTWLFAASDTLIRLFPTQFWIDAAVLIVVVTVGEMLLAGVLGLVGRRAYRSCGGAGGHGE